MKIATWDCEAWDLSPEFAPILCISIQDVHTGEIITLRQDEYVADGRAVDMTHDHLLVRDARDMLEQYDMTYGWYSKGYDIQLLNTRLARWGERLMESRLHVDGTWYFRGWRGLKTKTSKLKDVSKFFGFEPKPEVEPQIWLSARVGNKEAMDEIVERCEADTRITTVCIEQAIKLGLVKNIQRYP